MSSIKFTAKLPEEIQPGDKVRIKGILFDDAQQFSINFVNDSCEEPTRKPNNITYHFKWILDENVIVENYKENGSWIDHRENKYDALDGSIFELEFAFHESVIDVYKIYDGGHNRITSFFLTDFELSDIKYVQVWDDVLKIKELTFSYA